jgi:4-amino-4-deoxy-L-arabinose transferase-like glycosyltransferase
MRVRAGLLVLCLVTCVWGLGSVAIQDADEAFYAEAAREMVTGGDWITPHYNFEPRLQKPILYYWLTAATYTLTGVTEFAARIWAALAGIGLALVAFEAGRRWYDLRTGATAGAIVATCFGLVPGARQALPDVPLAFCITVSIWAAIEMTLAAADRGRARLWAVVSAAALGLGTLTKGPVALVLPALVLAPIVLADRRRPRASRAPATLITAGTAFVAGGVFLAIALPWYVAVTRAQGPEYLHQFFVGENVDRFATARYNSWRGWEYIPIVIGGLLPWSPFGLLWIGPIRRWIGGRRPLDGTEIRLLSWAFAPLAFFFVSVGSQARYILPCLVPFAILLGRTIMTRLDDGRRLFTAAAAIAGSVFVTLGIVVWRARPLLVAIDPDWSVAPAVLLMLAGAAVIGAAFLAPRRWLPVVLTLASAVGVAAFVQGVLTSGRPEPVERLAAAARANGPADRICACGAFARNILFYTHVRTVIADTGRSDEEVVAFLQTPERVLAAVDSRTLASVEARTAQRYPRLAEVSYLSLWQHPEALLAASPAAVQRVILISNR